MSATIYLKDYQPSAFLLEDVNLHFILDVQETIVRCTFTLKHNPLVHNVSDSCHFDGESLTLVSAMINGAEAKYERDEHSLTLEQVKDGDRVEFITEINPQENKALEGLFMTNGVFCTQCEAEGFRHITYFLDRPDIMADYTVTIEADKTEFPTLLSNGNMIKQGEHGDNRHFATYHDPHQKPCYLFALVAGRFDHLHDTFTTMSAKTVDCHIYVMPGNGEKSHHAMSALKKSMRWDEQHYGREYDLNIFNIVAVSDFVAGAMENKSLNIFNDKYILADANTATDIDYENIDRVVAHEYFHNWTGDRITCREWFDLCLKEGLTVFREQSFVEDDTDRVTARIDQVITLTDRQFKEDASPLSHPVRPTQYKQVNNFYTATVYEKGAEVFRMLAEIVGQVGFRKATDYYFDTYDGQAVTINEFVHSVEKTNDVDLSQFKQWYAQSGTPLVKVISEYDSTTQRLTVHFKQINKATHDQKQKHALHIPISIGLISVRGESLLDTQVLNFTKEEQSFSFDNISEKPILSLFRHFSAPVKVDYKQSFDELSILALHDTDRFNRWSVMQKIYLLVIDELINGKNNMLEPCVNLCGQLLNESSISRRVVAKCLTLPSDEVILSHYKPVDLDKMLNAKKQLFQAIAKAHKSKFYNIYTELNDGKDYVYENEAVNNRFLKNICLRFIASEASVTDKEFLQAQYAQTNNMTDELGALMALNTIAGNLRKKTLNDFYKKWQHEHLVVNKWLTCQALSPLDDAFAQVKNLTNHESFSLHNPNKVYALLLQFANYNLKGFHQKDGAAYDFIAEKVLQLDAISPQVASRLVHVFSSWHYFDDARQVLMKKALKKVQCNENLSVNVKEQVEKMLA